MLSVLLVTELPDVVEAVGGALIGPSYHLDTVADPFQAAAKWEEQQPEVLVVDMQVGTMGAMAVVRELLTVAAENGKPPSASVILLNRSADAFLARRAGADGWIAKPFSGFELRGLVDRLARERAKAST